MLPEFEICHREFSSYGLELTEEQYRRFDKYAEFLVEYNKNVNLTAITEPREILVKHFIDSVLLSKYADIPEKSALIDVGTGAGFPSVPLKIVRSDIKITLLDSLAKRITFLEKLCDMLEIEAEFIHGRAEDIARMAEYREKFDFSCARAVANLAVLSEYCMPFVKEGGFFLSMKGPSEEISTAGNAVKILGGEISDIAEYSLESDSRKIILIKKISQTLTKYPRNSGQIKKKPL
ncbi:MAG: 16S rRNA (guanine(527)-N(7))-methyltransferase RsmG [Ruminococcus flavefaciens]|nr:16S rRNA (guanine(527)-N(7))-methyltransferase RsmG [Ruminococcus flavefaciens]MCM1228640.1 16S rRNA (guanine(527)-N(7))-methyltransferase RsmG [Ruminococcus flavefaciens]